MSMLAKWVFWLSAVGLAYIYAGYPSLAWLLARLRPKPVRKSPFTGTFSVVIVASNEAATLPGKLLSLLGSNAASQMAEIIVASDGSSDGTPEACLRAGDSRIRVIEFTERRGKAAVLNDAVPEARSDVVVLTDARQELHPDALSRLLACFADPEVGAVSGELVFRRKDTDTAAARGIDFYWNYEKLIRESESRFASVPGATGAFYAVRKSLFRPIPADSLLDDVVIPMQIVVEGHRCVFEGGALAYDDPSQSPAQEAVRKRRTIAGVAQLVSHRPAWLIPWRNPIWFQYVSHKLLRLLSPFFLVGALVSNGVLLAARPYAVLGVLQALFYAAAIAGWMLRGSNRAKGILAAPLTFVALNAATLVALCDAARGRHRAAWERSESAV